MKLHLTKPHQYSVVEAAFYLELHPQSVYGLLREGLIHHRRKGRRKGRIYFLQQDLDDYLQSNSVRRAVK